MDIFSKRPLFISCMLFLTCSVIGYFLSENVKLILILLSVSILAFMLVLVLFRDYSSKKKYSFLVTILCLIMVAVSMISSYAYYNVRYDKRASFYDKECMIQGTVIEIRYENSFSSSYTLSVNSINEESDKHKAILECTYPAALEIGDRIVASVVASEPKSDGGRYNEKLSCMSDGVFVIYSSEGESSLEVTEYSNKEGIEVFFADLNHKMSSYLTSTVGADAGDLSSALFLGNKYLLSDTIVRDFRRVGASHILALSGLHMSLIMGAVMLILKATVRKLTPIAIILSLIAIFYLALTGFSISATRSVIMLLTVYLSLIISGIPDSLTALSVAGSVIVLVSPGSIADAAFWMSFAATLGILVYVSPLNQYFNEKIYARKNKLYRFGMKALCSLASAVATSLAALLPLIIVMCIFIKELSLLSILSSVVLSVPTAVIIISSLLFLPFGMIPYISTFFVHMIRVAAGMMIWYSSELARLEDIVISLNYPFAIAMAVLLGVALLFSLASRIRSGCYLSLIPFAVCLAVCIGAMTVYENINKDKLNVSYTNVSSNSGMIVLSDERKAVICDVSNGSMTSYEYALDEIYKNRATEIKAVMLTRYSFRHNATLSDLFNDNTVRELWLPMPETADDYYIMERLYKCAENNDVTVYVYEEGEALRIFENAYIEHLNTYIERSAVPIDLIGIYTESEHLTYASPAINESDLSDIAQYAFERSEYIIFGNRGPKPKTEYSIGSSKDVRYVDSVVFSSEAEVAYYIKPEPSIISHFLVSRGKTMNFYLDE